MVARSELSKRGSSYRLNSPQKVLMVTRRKSQMEKPVVGEEQVCSSCKENREDGVTNASKIGNF